MKLLLVALLILTSSVSVAYSQDKTIPDKEIQALCRSVKDIKKLPYDRNEKGVDLAYDKLREAGNAAVPCLIDNITNTQIMDDPRCPGITSVTIGDTSYFVLMDILGHLVEEFLPVRVQRAFKTEGFYAYHEYIDRPGARRQLQKLMRDWYAVNRKN